MLANFFGKSNPANFIILFLIFLGFYVANFLTAFSLDLFTIDVLIHELIIVGLFVLLFFIFNFILSKNKLTLYNSYGFLFFVLLLGIFPFTMMDRDVLIVNVVLLIFLRRVYSLRTPKSVLKKMFDSGFWLAILFILSPFTLIYGLFLYASILLFQKLNFRTFLIPLVGFLVPMLCYFTYCFWFDNVDGFLELFSWYTDYNFQFYTSIEIVAPLIFLGLIALISIILKTPKVFLISGNYRKFWTLTLLNLIVAIGLVVFTKNKTGAELLCVFFPLTIVLTNWIEGITKRFYQDVILAVFTLIPIIVFII
tara:strand:+ start:42408 stop:43334 length:927 start_codon:yes stop_codon:yes gene_type:complete